MNLILLVLVILLLVGGLGAAPVWGHSWGWGPTGGVGLIVIILIVLLLMGRI